MPDVTFVDDLPPSRRGEGRLARSGASYALVAVLRANPGQWAEIERYPAERRSAASSKGANYKKRHPGIEATTRQIGDEVVLYMRAVSA